MASENQDTRPRWFWPLVAFLIGLLVGWLVIGWAIWPVTWKNSLPPDLRAAERDEYLMMVAESFAASGDVAVAQERLATWPQDQLAQDLERLQERLVEENATQASQVQSLVSTLGTSPQAALIPTVQPVQGSQPPAGSTRLSDLPWRNVCVGALYALLVLLGLALIVWLWRRWRAAQAPVTGPAIEPFPPGWTEGPAGRSSTEAAGELKETWPEGMGSSTTLRTAQEGAGGFEGPARSSMGAEAGAVTHDAAEVAAAGLAAASAPVGRPGEATTIPGVLTKVSEYLAAYQMGEPDYDEAFDIKDGSGAYIGECGVALTDPVGRGHDQAAALQVWLWDKNDPDTKVKVLMSEGAYRDTAMRDQLAGEHAAIPVRTATEFELASYNLLLRGVVEKLDYAEQEPVRGIFAEVQLRLQVYQKGK